MNFVSPCAFRRTRSGVSVISLLILALGLCIAQTARAAPTIVQVNPNVAYPGQTISLTVSGADPVAANNLINFIQGGASVGQTAAKAVFPLSGTTLSKLTVTLPATLPPTTKGLSLTGALSLQIGSNGTPGAQRAFTFQSRPSLLDVSPAGVTLADAMPATIWQGKTATVTLTGSFTHFRQGVTKANFGPGIQVGGAASGQFGPVTVLSPTVATAALTADITAPLDVHGLTIQTAKEEVSSDAALIVIATGKPWMRVVLNTTMVAFESTSGSPQIQARVVAYDHNGNQVASPAFSLSVDPPGGVSIAGGTVTFTRVGGYNITATATIEGQLLSSTASAGVLGAPLSPNAGNGLANKQMNSQGRMSTLMNNLLAAAAANDVATVKSLGTALQNEINSTDYAALAAAKLLGTNASPNTNFNVVDVTISAGNKSATSHLPAESELPAVQQAADASYLIALNALNAELDVALAMFATLDPANPSDADTNKIKAESAKLDALLEAYAATTPSARVLYDNLPAVQSLLLQKLPAVSRANAQYILDLLKNAGLLVSSQSRPPLHDGVYRPNRDRHSVRKTQLGLLLGPLFGAVPFGNVMWKMYSQGIEQIELMIYVLTLAKLIPTNDLLGITGTLAGLSTCENTVSIGGGATHIFGFGFSPTVNDRVMLIGSQAVKPLYDCINSLLSKLFTGKGPGDCKANPKGCYDYIKGAYDLLKMCVDSITPGLAKVDLVDASDPRLSGATEGFDPCGGDFTDNTSEITVNSFLSQKTGTFDIVGILLVQNKDNGLQNILVVNQF